MIRWNGLAIIIALAACSTETPAGNVRCTVDDNCPFEQCCVSGTCVDPGPAGACAALSGDTSVITIANTLVAGETVPFAIRVSDAFGRPVAGSPVIVALESSCAACETVTLDTQTTDASGGITGRLSSTRAEQKNLVVSSGGAQSASKSITVIPSAAAGLGFTGVTDVPVNALLSAIAVTRVDAFGNGDALPNDTVPDGVTLSVTVTANAQALDLWNNGSPAGTLNLKLFGPRVSLGDVYIPMVAHGLTLTGTAETTFTSSPFAVTGPHFTSDLPDPLSAADGAVAVTWSVTPATDARVLDSYAPSPSTLKADSGAVVRPAFLNGGANIRVAELAPRLAYDVEATQISRPGSFFATEDTGAVVDRVHALPGGDVVVLGRFWGDLHLNDTTTITGISAFTHTYQSYVARFSSDFTQVRWFAANYAFADHGTDLTGIASLIRDSEVTGTDVLVLTQFTADSSGWDFQSNGVGKRCIAGGGNTHASAGIARLDLVTGEVVWCAAMSDPAKALGVVPRALRTVGPQHYVALTVASDVALYGGTIITASGQPQPVTSFVITQVTPDTSKKDCGTLVVGLFLPLIDASQTGGVTIGSNIIRTQVYVEANSIVVDAAGTGLIIGATVCAVQSSLQSGTSGGVTTLADDGMILHATGTVLTRVWQGGCAGDDGPLRAAQLEDGAYAVFMTFLGVCQLDPNQRGTPSGGAIAGRATGTQGLTASAVFTSAGTVTPRAMAVRGDRIVLSAFAPSDLSISGAPYAASQGSAVVVVAETDRFLNVRWTSQGSGLSGTSGQLDLLPNGGTLVAVSGGSARAIVGPLDATPLRILESTGDLRPLIYALEPYDFVARDVR